MWLSDYQAAFVIGIMEKWNTGIMVKKVRASTEFDLVP